MSSSWVLKFPRSDDEGFLLLQVSSIGDSVLDLNLLATEGEAPYRGKSTSNRFTLTDKHVLNEHQFARGRLQTSEPRISMVATTNGRISSVTSSIPNPHPRFQMTYAKASRPLPRSTRAKPPSQSEIASTKSHKDSAQSRSPRMTTPKSNSSTGAAPQSTKKQPSKPKKLTCNASTSAPNPPSRPSTPD